MKKKNQFFGVLINSFQFYDNPLQMVRGILFTIWKSIWDVFSVSNIPDIWICIIYVLMFQTYVIDIKY